ncbi:DUF1819 family protein [Succinimonas amylolytica]|uniref:DUF1819 family protein n=1 Tax=Succinimonas amylolytica TaxID=83769 RepID=UPI0023A89E40
MSKIKSPYNASITREQFLFFETRTTARLLNEGFSKDEAIQKIIEENLFQYPTEKSIRKMANCCLRRLECLGDDSLIKMLATRPADESKQICLYAMMCQYRLIWDFMITVIGEKYKKFDTSFGKMDLNVFFMQLQEQDDWVAAWTDATIGKLKQVIKKILVENQYLDHADADHINPVLISFDLENAIRAAGKEVALPAFNCLL